MAYTKYTQAQLKALVKEGAAIDITNENKKRAGLHVIGVSHGVYGVNGLLLRGNSGRMYAVTARSGAVFLYL